MSFSSLCLENTVSSVAESEQSTSATLVEELKPYQTCYNDNYTKVATYLINIAKPTDKPVYKKTHIYFLTNYGGGCISEGEPDDFL